MVLFCASLAIFLAAGLVALPLRSARAAGTVGVAGMVLGSLLGLVPAGQALFLGEGVWLRQPWFPPFGSFSLEIDPLSGFFLLPLYLLCILSAPYGHAYLKSHGGQRPLGPAWFFTNVLAASMALVLTARNGLLFLVAWEVMALSSFFLVVRDNERQAVRQAGWTYLVATHLGTMFLLALFALLSPAGGSMDFALFSPGGRAGMLFVLALVGFGTKAGLMPLHVWLPEAHPAAPSHISALMSGVMIKTGIYGLVRIITLLGPPEAWWGWTLVALGASSGICGVAFALAQHDLKRLLAYHSVENIGIIVLGLGVGMLGQTWGQPVVAALGYAGALFHVLNHAVFKGLLFLCAGSVLHGVGHDHIEKLGGLLKRLPVTGATFLVGSAAICGLPPLNGFASEFLIVLAALSGGGSAAMGVSLPCIVTILALALISGLAVACFAKAGGVVFLGEPRDPAAAAAHESPRAMLVPMLILAGLCLALGLGAPLAVRGLVRAVLVLAPDSALTVPALRESATWLSRVALAGGLLLALAGLLTWARALLLRGRPVGGTVTWGCGYTAPTPRMQYTAGSFAQPLTDMLRHVLWTRTRETAPRGYFPGPASFHDETPDPARERLFSPLHLALVQAAERLRWLQHGRIQVYILYILLTLVALLAWTLR